MNQTKLLSLCLCLFWLPSFASAQDNSLRKRLLDNDKDAVRKVQNSQVMNKILTVVNNPQLCKELEIPEYQLKELRSIASEYKKRLQEFSYHNQSRIQDAQKSLLEDKTDANALKTLQEIQEEMLAIGEGEIMRLNQVLLPHQTERIFQIAKQDLLKYQSGFGDEFGMVYGLVDELELTESEKRKLKKAIEAARKEYYSEVAKLKKETHEKILESLPKEKRKAVKELIGDTYDAAKERRVQFGEKAKEEEKEDADN